MFFPGFLVSIPKVSKYILVYVINSNVSLKISLSRFHFTTESDRSIVSSKRLFYCFLVHIQYGFIQPSLHTGMQLHTGLYDKLR